jgi:ABC-type oligopeptide transport system substrate-binding subunit
LTVNIKFQKEVLFMKRIICLLCALICVVGALTACGNKTKTQSSDKPVETQTENIKPNEPFEKNEATEATETTVATNIPATLSAADYQSYSGGNLSALEAVLGTNHTWEVTKGCLVDGGDMGLAVWTAADGSAITAQCEMNAGSTEWIVKFVF